MNPDLALFRLINGLAGQWPVIDELFRFVANDYVVPTTLVAILVLGWFSGTTRWRFTVIEAIFALLMSNAIVKVINVLWFRPRPFTFNDVNLLFYYPSDSSFPANSAAAVWALAWLLWITQRESRFAWVGLLLAALMGFSRIWIGVHYPLDILGGAAVGILAAELIVRSRARLLPVINVIRRAAEMLALT
jgi:undecaprenyl-diphosphatase